MMNMGLGEGVICSLDLFYCFMFKFFVFMCFFFSIVFECKVLILGKYVDCCKVLEIVYGIRIV